jgi:DNA-binding transcriptional MerR regulator
MNMTTSMNTAQQDLDNEQEVATTKPKARLSSEATISMPKKVKKSKDAFRTISEVAKKLDVQQHVLRFWETKFSQVRPLKRGGGRRYYRPEDVALLQRIHHLLYTEGYTIKGVQKLLKEQGKAQMIATQMEASNGQPAAKSKEAQVQPDQSQSHQGAGSTVSKTMSDQQRAVLEIMLSELKAMRAMIKV